MNIWKCPLCRNVCTSISVRELLACLAQLPKLITSRILRNVERQPCDSGVMALWYRLTMEGGNFNELRSLNPAKLKLKRRSFYLSMSHMQAHTHECTREHTHTHTHTHTHINTTKRQRRQSYRRMTMYMYKLRYSKLIRTPLAYMQMYRIVLSEIGIKFVAFVGLFPSEYAVSFTTLLHPISKSGRIYLMRHDTVSAVCAFFHF